MRFPCNTPEEPVEVPPCSSPTLKYPRELLYGCLAHAKALTPWEQHRNLGIGLL